MTTLSLYEDLHACHPIPSEILGRGINVSNSVHKNEARIFCTLQYFLKSRCFRNTKTKGMLFRLVYVIKIKAEALILIVYLFSIYT
jgi:hypothetical protein